MPTKTEKAKPETHAFQAETRQLLDIVIHSLYSNKEIFLRELISNASDALDRLRFEALTEEGLLGGDKHGETLEIRLEVDAEARTLSVIDNGIGMSREEVVENIGTIAKSGSRELMARIEDSKQTDVAELIGQFGVGFYSAFMVADKVELLTRRAGEETATRWTSTGDGEYTLSEDSRFMRGTTVTLHLKPVDEENGVLDFTDFHVLQRIAKRYSDFVAYPIKLEHSREEAERDEEGKPIEGKTTTVVEDKTLNSMKPIWTRPKSEVSDEEYAEFYRHISHDWSEPLDTLSLHAEGRIEYQALLFLPSKAPFDLYYRDQSYGLQLYVRRVLIMDSCEELLPPYLRFVKGVVDSADLPLNVSRELIQQDRHIRQIRTWLTRKVLDHLQDMKAEDEAEYRGFFAEFGRVLKEGVASDSENKDRLLGLLLFPSSHRAEAADGKDESADATDAAGPLTSLAEYAGRMKSEQEEIYYLTGESIAAVESSPHLEAFRDKGYEVLYMVDPVDELVVQSVFEFEGKKLRSVGKGTIELGTEEEKKKAQEALEEKREAYGDLLQLLAAKLDEWVKEVRLSNRLTTSPVCLVGGEMDLSPQLERLLRATEGGGVPRQKRIMELNPEHPILTKMQERFAKSEEDGDGKGGDDPRLADYAHLLLGYALLAEGSELPDPARFNKLVAELMVESL